MIKFIKNLFKGSKQQCDIPDVSGELKTSTTKSNKFRQSVKFDSEIEQFYYDQSRRMMKDNGMSSMNAFLKDEFPNIPEEALKISKDRFGEILNIAHKDYLTLCSDPHGLQSGF